MTTPWPRRRIGEIANHSLGKMLDRARDQGEPKPYLRNQNVRWFGFDLRDLNVMGFKLEEDAKCTAVKGDVLVCEGGYPGRAAIWDRDEPIHFQKAIHRVRFHEPERGKWFLYYLYAKSADGTLRRHLSGTGIQHFTGEALDAFEVPLPPLDEQRRIVCQLDEAFQAIDSARENAEKSIRNARGMFESQLEFVFAQPSGGWVSTGRPLADLCELIVDCEHKTAPTQESGIPSIRTPNIGRGELLLDGVKRVSEDTYREWTRRAEPVPGDLILAREAPAGMVAVIPDGLRVCLGQRTVLIRPRGAAFEPEFLAWLLLQDRMQRKLLAHSRGATVQHVNMKDIRALDVGPVPPLSEQRQVVSRVRQAKRDCDLLATIYERKLAALDELKQSLLHAAFARNL